MLDISTIIKHYKRSEVQDAIARFSVGRECVPRFTDVFGKRPDVVIQPRDVLELAKRGASSLHISEERWGNPLLLRPELSRRELDDLRVGWDLVLDIDCDSFVISTITAKLVLDFLKYKDVVPSVKFSGNHGWHIGVCFESFPKAVSLKDGVVLVKDFFPEGPRRVAEYIKHYIKEELRKQLTSLGPDEISRLTGIKVGDFLTAEKTINPYEIVEIDTVLISSRHLFRAPYSLHEKSGLVSVPWDVDKLDDFDFGFARPDNISFEVGFLDKKCDASGFLRDAFDFSPNVDSPKVSDAPKPRFFDESVVKIPEQAWPPCIKLICQGLTDGRKRASFILTNFLSTVGWNVDEVEEFLREWNKKNPEPLRETFLLASLRYRKGRNSKSTSPNSSPPPPNCQNAGYMKALGVCKPDSFCANISNPAVYAIRRARQGRR